MKRCDICKREIEKNRDVCDECINNILSSEETELNEGVENGRTKIS